MYQHIKHVWFVRTVPCFRPSLNPPLYWRPSTHVNTHTSSPAELLVAAALPDVPSILAMPPEKSGCLLAPALVCALDALSVLSNLLFLYVPLYSQHPLPKCTWPMGHVNVIPMLLPNVYIYDNSRKKNIK
jgi:hypothetical protein